MQESAVARERTVFSDYISALITAREPPSPQLVEDVLGSLWIALRGELRRKGLWHQPPSYLGVYGWTSWREAVAATFQAGGCPGAAWELVVECFKYIFIDRHRYLARQLEVKPDVEGLVYRNVRNFLYDTQRKHDPLGFRVFMVARAAVLTAVGEGELAILSGDPKVRNGTVLGSEAGEAVSGTKANLEDIVRTWNDILLPDLITARGRHQDKVTAVLRSLLADLPAQGVVRWRFQALVEPLKHDVRARWSSIWERAAGSTAVEAGEGGRSRIVRRIGPSTRFEDRDAFRALAACVTASMSRLEESPATLHYLAILWRFLRIFATDFAGQQQDLGGAPRELVMAGDLPSRRQLAEELGIPRNRMPRLFELLGELTESCRRHPGRAWGEPATSAALMSDGKPARSQVVAGLIEGWVAVQRRTAEEEIRLREQAARPPAPGDLFVVPDVEEPGVEWAVLERDPRDGGSWTVLPADANPLVGSADVAVAPSAGSGPLTLRCGLAVRVPAAVLEPRRRTGMLEPEILARAVAKRRLVELGTPGGDESELEVDADPEYRQWKQDVLEPARASLSGSPQPPCEGPGRLVAFPAAARNSRRRFYGLAATALLAVTFGASTGWMLQRQRVRSAEAELGSLRDEVGGLERQRQELERERRELRRARQMLSRAQRLQLADREAGSPASQQPEVQVNPPQVTFGADSVRGTARRITVSEDDRFLLAMLPVEDGSSTYGLEVVRVKTEETVLRMSGLQPSRWSDLVLILPLRLLGSGDYRLRLERSGGAGAGPAAEYSLRIEVE